RCAQPINRRTQPFIEARELPDEMHERRNNHPVEDAVEESALEHNQEDATPHAIRRDHLEVPDGAARPIAEGVFHSMQVVEDVWSAQELQEPETGMSGHVHERDRVPADPDLDDHDSDL